MGLSLLKHNWKCGIDIICVTRDELITVKLSKSEFCRFPISAYLESVGSG